MMNDDFQFNSDIQKKWYSMARSIDTASNIANIALVGKYTSQLDSYLSVISALKHACIASNQRLNLIMVESSYLEDDVKLENPALYEDAWNKLISAQGILVPGGFGIRGIEGKINAIKYARENKIPFLGICLGMQACVIEYTRAFLNKPLANSREFAPNINDNDSAIIFMPEGNKEQMGGTMRLGIRRTILDPNSRAFKLYGEKKEILERHRHRYEVNPTFVESLEEKGLLFTGKDENFERMEIVEIHSNEHPYFIGVQFHPEFVSRPLSPSPVFYGLLNAVKERNSNI